VGEQRTVNNGSEGEGGRCHNGRVRADIDILFIIVIIIVIIIIITFAAASSAEEISREPYRFTATAVAA